MHAGKKTSILPSRHNLKTYLAVTTKRNCIWSSRQYYTGEFGRDDKIHDMYSVVTAQCKICIVPLCEHMTRMPNVFSLEMPNFSAFRLFVFHRKRRLLVSLFLVFIFLGLFRVYISSLHVDLRLLNIFRLEVLRK